MVTSDTDSSGGRGRYVAEPGSDGYGVGPNWQGTRPPMVAGNMSSANELRSREDILRVLRL
jgi:hypothetical protein